MENADMNWRKATYSNGGENCVVTASGSRVVLVRDTKGRAGGTLAFTPGAWEQFTASLR